MGKAKSRWRPSITNFHAGIKTGAGNRLMHTTPRETKREIEMRIEDYERKRASNPLYDIAYGVLIGELRKYKEAI